MTTELELHRGSRVVIDPSTTLPTDSMAEEWRGRECSVVVQIHGSIFKYVKVESLDGKQRGTFRTADLRRA